jgi:hypothetical protein
VLRSQCSRGNPPDQAQHYVRNTGKPRLAEFAVKTRAANYHYTPEKLRMECVGKTCCAATRVCPNRRKFVSLFPGAGEGIRTPDPLITNQMLYRLSYASSSGEYVPSHKLLPLIPSTCPGQLAKLSYRQSQAQQWLATSVSPKRCHRIDRRCPGGGQQRSHQRQEDHGYRR